ncbi:MAG: NosD domain-containing protein [Halobacteriota archaeon]
MKSERRKIEVALTFAVLFATLAFVSIECASATTIYVPDIYPTIQEAVNNATANDTILVRDGAYTENVDVNVNNLTIQSENGSANCIVQAVNSSDHVFEVTADYVNISGFTVRSGATGGYPYYPAGIYLYYADMCNISNNNCSNNVYGILLYYSSYNSITGNNANYLGNGIFLLYSSNNTIINNNVSNNDYGISLRGYSNSNTITNNNVSNNIHGISFDSSSYNTLTSNIFLNDGFTVFNSYQNTVEDNTVNGKPLVYLEDASDTVVLDAGQVILIKCRNITIENLNLSNTNVGIKLWETGDSKISKNTVCNNNWGGIYLTYSNNNSIVNNNCSNSDNDDGIQLRHSNNNSIANNNCSNNSDGIQLEYSNNNSITNNNCSSNKWVGIDLDCSNNNNSITNNNCSSNDRAGINLDYSNNNSITNNNCSNNWYGIYLDYSNNNNVANNNCSNNGYGILLGCSRNNKLTGNTMLGNGIGNGILIGGKSLSDYIHEIDESNTINGKPVYYWKDVNGGRIPDGAGQVILVSCKEVVVENQNLNDGSVGIEIAFSSYITITNNNCSNNIYGILLLYSNSSSITNNNCSNNGYGIDIDYSNNNSIANNNCSSNIDDGIQLGDSNNNYITNNNCSSNNRYGIFLDDSNSNKIYLNNFINNTDNVYSRDSTNIWNSTSKITYTYNGSTYTNYLGNYWADYTDVDANNDGILDNPYSIDSDRDYHPLVVPFENYFAPVENIFDTRAPANPYPSIFGMHNGTITTKQTITVSKLHTYPCSGTGGHTEYARIWNSTWEGVEAHWEGYKGEWHNIYFNESFMLVKDKTYNYTIRTGSYPQIIHKKEFNATGGKITCSEFVDANGKVYYNWIPAIRFEGITN